MYIDLSSPNTTLVLNPDGTYRLQTKQPMYYNNDTHEFAGWLYSIYSRVELKDNEIHVLPHDIPEDKWLRNNPHIFEDNDMWEDDF